MLFLAKIRFAKMEIKSHLFEIMLLCFLHSVLLFYYLSVLLEPNFLKKGKKKKKKEREKKRKEGIPGFLMHSHIYY